MPAWRHVLPKVGFLWLLICAQSGEPDIKIYSENTDGFNTGVPFSQWLHHIVIQIPEPAGGPTGWLHQNKIDKAVLFTKIR
jgi:hypothetical protein